MADRLGGTPPAPHESGTVEAAVEVATTTVEAATAPVKVVVEAEPLRGARRQSTRGA
jgi:hypothetical protein